MSMQNIKCDDTRNLWNLGRVSVLGISTDAKTLFTALVLRCGRNKSTSKYYIPINGSFETNNYKTLITDKKYFA
jgi:hypothetical protein